MSRASHPRRHPRGLSTWPPLACFLLLLVSLAPAPAQSPEPLHPARTRFSASRAAPSGAPTAPALASARAQNTALTLARSAALAANPALAPLSAPWIPAGPAAIQSLQFGAISGRVTSLALDPADPSGNTLFVGTAGGGVWRSINAAGPVAQVAFTPLTDTLPAFSPSAGSSAAPSLSIGALLALPGGLVLAGTGDPNDSDDSFYGTGLLRSTDSGLTWSLITGSSDGVAGTHSFFGLGFAGFAASTSNPNLLVAAVSASEGGTLVHATGTASTAGLYVSSDAGLTWRLATALDGATTVLSPLPNGANNGGIPATSVVWNPIRQRFFAALRYHGYYQSADGLTWTRLATQPGSGLSLSACPTLGSSSTCPLLRGALAVQPTTGDTFALTVDRDNHDGGLFADICQLSGTACASATPTFATHLVSSPLDLPATASPTISQADYNLTLAALPTGAAGQGTLLFVGTSDLFRCSLTTTGCSLRNTTNTANGCAAPAGVAPAQHALALSSGGSPVLYVGNDGGLWRSVDTVNQQASPCSVDDAAHFQNLNLSLGSLAEVVSLAQDPVDPAILLAGLGASGTVSIARADQTAWQQLSSAEGGTVLIDPTHPNFWYISTAAGVSLTPCLNGAACTAADLAASTPVGPAQLAGDLALLDAPSLLDPLFPGTLLTGTCRVWRGPPTLPSLWSSSNRASPQLTGPQGSSCTSANGLIRSLAAGGPATATGSGVLYAGLAGTLAGGGTLGGHLFATLSAGLSTATTSWSDLATAPVTSDAFNHSVFNPAGFSLSSVTADPHDATGRTVYVTVQGFNLATGAVPHLYRSTDAGAHWLNLSANLPGAPANALVVDPNDANTVYIALDTGVYATTSISTCSTTNCWSLFGTALPNSPVTTLAAAPAPALPTGDGRLGLLRAGTDGRGLWQIPLLTASTVQQPAMTLSPSTLAFAPGIVGATSAAQTIIVTNTGSAPLVVSRVAITSSNAPVGVQGTVVDFTETDTCTGVSVAPGSTCSLAVSFLPSATGSRASTLTIYGNVSGGQATASLSGIASAPASVQLTPSSLTFPATALSASSAAQNLVLQNTGGTTVSLSSVTIAGADFQLGFSSCSASLAPGTSCTLSVTFRPSSLGPRAGLVSITDSLGTQTATLSATATSPPTDALSSTALIFPATEVGSNSATQQLVLTNAGDIALTLITTSVSAASFGAPDFSATNSCGNSLAAHSACAVSVTFNPHSVGALTASLTLADAFRTQVVTLSGTAVAPPGISLLPSSTVTFPSAGVGTTSAPQLLTLTNNGGLPLLLGSITVSGDFALAASGSTCAVSLAPGTACIVAVVFSPVSSGLRAGSLTITDNAPASPTSPQAGVQVVPLSGTAIDFSVSADGPTALTVASGKPAVFPLLFSTPASATGTAALTCTGAPANSLCSLSPSTLPLGGSNATVVIVTLATGQAIPAGTSAAVGPLAPAGRLLVSAQPSRSRQTLRGALLRLGPTSCSWLALLLPAGLVTLRLRIQRLPTLLALCLAVLIPLSGCSSTPRQLPGPAGSSTGTSPSSASPTPPGTYTLTVTATAAGLSRSVNLVVTVQ